MQKHQSPSTKSLVLFAAMALSLSIPSISAFSVAITPPASRTTTTSQPLHYANIVDPPVPFDQGQDNDQRQNGNQNNNSNHGHNDKTNGSFEQRMRNLLQEELRKQQQQKEQLGRRRRAQHVFGSRPAELREVDTVEDFKRVVVDESSKLTVVRFYAPFCKACRAATPAFDSLVRQYQKEDHSDQTIQFVEVPITKETAALHQALGVKSIPFGHIYHPSAGLVEELRMVRPQMKKFGHILQTYANRQVDLPEDVNPETGIFDAPF